ncbi:MAG: AAA family ATPase [Alphaproteobacteria bacterium]|nr:AAA family ATPase [Alphaproteobacteria bacterium]
MSVAALDTRRDSGVSLAAFAADAETAGLIDRVASFHWPGATVLEGGLGAAATYLGQTRAPDLLVVDLGDSPEPLEELLTLADSCEPTTQVVALGTVNDLGLYKQFVAAGVADYLVKPVNADELETALLAAAFREHQQDDPADVPLGKVIVTIGARGGAGATTVATNGAWTLAEEFGQKVVLVDLDLQFGSTALSLDVVPAGGMIETLRNPDRVDGLFMASALVPKTPNFSILAAEEDIGRDASFNAAGADRLVAELRRSFGWVWVDLPRALCHLNAGLLTEASHVQIVSDLSLVGMRDTMRIANFCDGLNREAEIGVVLNRIGKAGAISAAQFAKGVPKPVIARLPDDPKAVNAATSGKPLAEVAGRGKLTRAVRQIVEDIAPHPEKRRALLLPFRRRDEEDDG